MYGFGEIDVTEAWSRIHRLRREARVAVAPHAYALYCLSRALAEIPDLNAYRRGRRLISFADVDIGTTVERRMPDDGRRYAAGFVLRAAQAMSLAEINRELRRITRLDPAQDGTIARRRRLARLPGLVRWLMGRKLSADPFAFKRMYGTVGLTSLNLPGHKQPLFALPPNPYTLTVATGTVTERAVPLADGGVTVRRFMSVATGADHTVVDGLTVARFGRAFARLMASGEGLDDECAAQSRRLAEQPA